MSSVIWKKKKRKKEQGHSPFNHPLICKNQNQHSFMPSQENILYMTFFFIGK